MRQAGESACSTVGINELRDVVGRAFNLSRSFVAADFLVGAHALQSGYNLLTLDDRFYRAVFPELDITVP